eukprot:SAG11_NODE_338_length_10535_cov_8.199885_12_plen_147_part_00
MFPPPICMRHAWLMPSVQELRASPCVLPFRSCSNSQFENQSQIERLLSCCERLTARGAAECGAPTSAANTARMEPPLAVALMRSERLDLRAPLVRAGLCSISAFMAASDAEGGEGNEQKPLRLLQLPVNLEMKRLGERILGQVRND